VAADTNAAGLCDGPHVGSDPSSLWVYLEGNGEVRLLQEES